MTIETDPQPPPQPDGHEPGPWILRGRVKTIEHNYGFITDETGLDRFFHCSEVIGGRDKFVLLTEGCEVDFIPKMGNRGPRAAGILKRKVGVNG